MAEPYFHMQTGFLSCVKKEVKFKKSMRPHTFISLS
jgi:hypothetical protein